MFRKVPFQREAHISVQNVQSKSKSKSKDADWRMCYYPQCNQSCSHNDLKDTTLKAPKSFEKNLGAKTNNERYAKLYDVINFGLTDITFGEQKVKANEPKNPINQTVQQGGDRNLCGCCAAGGTGVLHKQVEPCGKNTQ